jgi:hypothetical protein
MHMRASVALAIFVKLPLFLHIHSLKLSYSSPIKFYKFRSLTCEDSPDEREMQAWWRRQQLTRTPNRHLWATSRTKQPARLSTQRKNYGREQMTKPIRA